MANPIVDLNQLVVDAEIYPLIRGGGGGVPPTRQLFATAPFVTVNGLSVATLASDVTIAAVTTGGGLFLVGSGRLIAGTSPIRINAGASATLVGDITITALPFSGTIDGIVVHNPGGVQGKFLKDDNTWGNSTGSGVTSLIAGQAISLSPASGLGDVTVTVPLAAIAQIGVVPATGGTDATKFLCMTNPISWVAVPNVGAVVRLQVSTPGTGDVGYAHITGSMIIEQKVLVGPGLSAGEAGVEGFPTDAGVALVTGVDTLGASMMLQRSQATANPQYILFRKSRGTVAVPQPTIDGDYVGAINFRGRPTANFNDWGVNGAQIAAVADGAPNVPSDYQALYLDMLAGSPTTSAYIRASKDGVRVGLNFATVDRALSGLDVAGSFGLKVTTKTANFTPADTDCVYLCDSTTLSFVATLPTAVGRKGRVYTFVRVDATIHTIDIATTGGQTISSMASWRLWQIGESLTVHSDGANWWISSSVGQLNQFTSLADGAALANSVAETQIAGWDTWNAALRAGTVARALLFGKYSTTGTPTLRFKIKNSSDFVIADSGAVTCPTIVNGAFAIEFEAVNRTLAGAARILRATLMLGQTAGVGAAMNTYLMGDVAMASIAGGGVIPSYITAQWSAASASNTLTAIQGEASITPGTQQA